MIKHVVKQGECFSTIAADYRFTDYKTLYNAPENAALKQKRPSPNVLFPGDIVVIPDKKEGNSHVPTGQRHIYVKHPGAQTYLRLNLINNIGNPLAHTKCVLEVENHKLPGVTNGNGLVEFEVPITAREAELIFWEKTDAQDVGECRLQIQLGSLDPVEEQSGSHARLDNLGFAAGESLAQYERAAQRFQTAYELPLTAHLDTEATERLDKTHDVYERYETS